MAVALRTAGFRVSAQCAVPVRFRGEQIGDFRADLIVDDKVIVELKAGRAIEPARVAQLLNYLRATKLEIGLILNFGPSPGIRRLAFSKDQRWSALVSG
jgi:GxxExxY protein